MGNLHFFNFSSICHVIQWEFHIFFIFHQFPMLFNGEFAFYQFPMLFNREALGGGTEGGKDGRTDIWKFTPVSYRTSALWGRCPKNGRRYQLETNFNRFLRQLCIQLLTWYKFVAHFTYFSYCFLCPFRK